MQVIIFHCKNNNVMWLILSEENSTGQLSLALSDIFAAMVLNRKICMISFTMHATK